MSTSTKTNPAPAPQWVERRAKLFQAGEYPDKGVTVTEEHLTTLATSFSDPVPVLIEHAESPLEIGYLTAVFSEGSELFGTVALTPEAEALVERSGAKSLSLGLAPDLSSIREVSLVRSPRVADARLFGGEVGFEGRLEWDLRDEGDGGDGGDPVASILASPPSPPSLGSQWRELRSAQVDHELRDLMRQGRICPAQMQFAKALLMTDDTVEFDGKSTPVRQLALGLIQRQPKSNLFSELAPASESDHSQHLMLPEEAAFYKRYFPEVSLEEIAKKR